MLAIIDYGMGNLASVAKALQHVAPTEDVRIVCDAATIARADRVILPGQSAMPDSMKAMRESGLLDVTLNALKNKPALGVCLGLHMFFEHSDEGDCSALGLLKGSVKRFPNPHHDDKGQLLKVPHMGWNAVHFSDTHRAHPLWQGVVDGSAFYFANSFYALPNDPAAIAGEAHYPWPFACAVAHENLFAVQFHPEKSSAAGLKILQNFVAWQP